MTIKEFIKSALTEKEKPYQALINKEVSFEIGHWGDEVRFIITTSNIQLEEHIEKYRLLDSLDNFEIKEENEEPLYNRAYNKGDYTIKSLSEEVLINGNGQPLFYLSQFDRNHKFVSKIENGQLILELVVIAGDRHLKGKLIPKS